MNILFLTHRVPYPPNRGDRIRAYHMLKHLAGAHKVSLVSLADEPVPASARTGLERFCQSVDLVPVGRLRWLSALTSLAAGRSLTEGALRSRRARAAIRRCVATERPDLAIAYCSGMAAYLDDPSLQRVPAICDLVDVDSQKWRDYADSTRGVRRMLYAVEARRVLRAEERIVRRCQHVTLVSEQEARLFRTLIPNSNAHCVPNGVDCEYFSPQPVPEPGMDRLAFVGALDYFPNIQGVRWFCERVWPRVRASHPRARLAIVGRNPSPSVLRLGRAAGVAVMGDVPDVRPYLAEASLVVAPLKIARGVQNKVLEAMAMAKAVLASPEALCGIQATPGFDVMCARTPHEWIRHVDDSLCNADLCSQIGRRGRKFVATQHAWPSCLRALDDLIAELATSSTAKCGAPSWQRDAHVAVGLETL